MQVPVAERPYKLKSGKYSVPGTLKRAIYQVYSKDNSTQGVRAEYHVSWNKKRAPHGHLIEYETSRTAARPFVAPAYYAKERDALALANQLWLQATKERLAKIR